MTRMPKPGRLDCSLCHAGGCHNGFNKTMTTSTDGNWRIRRNPLAWGSTEPVVVTLGFSKGQNAIDALSNPRSSVNDIPYAKKRSWVGRILHAVGLLPTPDEKSVTEAIADIHGLHHFGSLVRCTVEQRVGEDWVTSGNGMLEGFSAHPFGAAVTETCIRTFLGDLPKSVRLIVLFGYGRNLGGRKKGRADKFSYVENVKRLMERSFGAEMQSFSPVAYFNEKVSVVHVEHFAEPANATNWLSADRTERSRLRLMSKEAVSFALSR